ncbi:MAG: glycosyltransferase [Anaerolineae bacterium]
MISAHVQADVATRTRDALLPASLIICSRNRARLLAETVASVLHGDDVPAELIVIDQSDAPHPTLAYLTPPGSCRLRYTWSHSVGLGRARNLGIAAAKHPIVAFVDDDVLAPPTWFGSLIRAQLDAGPRAAITGRVIQVDDAPDGFAPSLKDDTLPAVYEGRLNKDVLWGNNMVMYRSAAEEVGLFDERLGPGALFPCADDNDYGFRLLEAGYRILYVPEALIYHRAWRSEKDYVRLRWAYGRGQGAFYAKHLSLTDPYMLRRLAGGVRGHALSAVTRFRRHRRLAYGDAAYTAGLISSVAEWLVSQRGRGDER